MHRSLLNTYQGRAGHQEVHSQREENQIVAWLIFTIPSSLLKYHQRLDKAVDAGYGKLTFATEAERVPLLFERHQELVTPLMNPKSQNNGQRKTDI